MCMYTGQLNILRWLTYGFLLENLQVSHSQVLYVEYGSIHTPLFWQPLPIDAWEDIDHEAFLLQLP